MYRIYMDIDCPECGETNYIGPIGSLTEHDGLPVYSYDMAARESVSATAARSS